MCLFFSVQKIKIAEEKRTDTEEKLWKTQNTKPKPQSNKKQGGRTCLPKDLRIDAAKTNKAGRTGQQAERT